MLTVWSKKISDSDKFMISEKPIQAKSEHSQSENREERYLHWWLTVLSHPVPPHLLAHAAFWQFCILHLNMSFINFKASCVQ